MQFVLGLVHTYIKPLWSGHEADYYHVVRFLVEKHRLPDEADYPAGDADLRQATQPPLFFLVSAPIVALFDDAQPIPPGSQPQLVCLGGETASRFSPGYPLTPAYILPGHGSVLAGYGLRVLNLLFGLLAVVMTYGAGRVLFQPYPLIALVGAALLAFEPNTLQLVTGISNDPLLLAIAAANLYCAARLLANGMIRWRWTLPLVGTVMLALLTRLSGWAVLGLTLLIMVYALARTLMLARKQVTRGQIRVALVGIALLVFALASVATFNYRQTGSVFGRYHNLDNIVARAVANFNLPVETVVGVLDQTRNSYLEPLSALTTRRGVQSLYVAPVLVAFVAVLVWLALPRPRSARKHPKPDLTPYLLLISGVAVAAGLVLFRNMLNVSFTGGVTNYNTGAIFAPLRYYNGGLPSLALLISAGLMLLVEPIRLRFATTDHLLRVLFNANPVGVGLAVVWLAVALLSAVQVVQSRPHFEVLDLQTYQQTLSSPTAGTDSGRGDAPVLYHSSVTPHPDDGLLSLTLYGRQQEPTMLNYAVQVDMTRAGRVINSCQFMPAGGNYPTTLWPTSSVVSFSAAIPNCAGTLAGPVDVSLRWLGADMQGRIQSQSPPVHLATIQASLAQAKTCPANLGVIGAGYRATKFNSPESIRVGEPYLPSLNWIVTQSEPDVAGRTFSFKHQKTGEEYTCALADRPASMWGQGEYVFFDRCWMQFPLQATPGDYLASVFMVNAAGQRLPATDAQGNPLPEKSVSLGIVKLEP